ncbi:MAG: outer membrane beta-barrel protein [Chitinophagaceae bacterium]|nr:outer membrane beta-barrel protein [Chitinophagaceae bacterium]
MKKYILVFSFFLFMINGWLTAQKIRKESPSPTTTISAQDVERLPFSKRTWEFTITKPNLAFSQKQVKVNGIDQGSQTSFLLDVGAHYYLIDNIAVGVEVIMSNNTFKNNGDKDVLNSWMSYADVTYGRNLGGIVNIYARAGVGVGSSTFKYTPQYGPETKNKSDLFGYKFNIGMPIRLDGNAYLTPEIGYWYNREKFDGGSETDNRFGLGLKLETFLQCDDAAREAARNYRSQHQMYSPGSSFLGISTEGGFSFGDTEIKYDNNFPPPSKQKYSLADLLLSYNYYFIKNLSGGLNVNFSNSVYKNSMSDYRQSNTNFSITPMLELNMPVENHTLNDLFIRGGYSFGTQKSEYKMGMFNNTSKATMGSLCVGLGYNFFFKKKLSITPVFEYDWTTYNDKDNDQKEKYNGPNFSVGERKFFR